jgi:hypothetical protein
MAKSLLIVLLMFVIFLVNVGCNDKGQESNGSVQSISNNTAKTSETKPLVTEITESTIIELFMQTYDVDKEDILVPIRTDIDNDGIIDLILAADTQKAYGLGRVSIYNLKDGNEMATVEVPEAASDRLLEVLILKNVTYGNVIAVMTQYRDKGGTIYSVSSSKFNPIISIDGASVEFEDIDKNGFEEIKVSEMDWANSDSMVNAKYIDNLYKWDGNTYSREREDKSKNNSPDLSTDVFTAIAGQWSPENPNTNKGIKIYKKNDKSGEIVYVDMFTALDSDPVSFTISEVNENTITLDLDGEELSISFEDSVHASFKDGQAVMSYQKIIDYDVEHELLRSLDGYWISDLGIYFKIKISDDLNEVEIRSTYGEGVMERHYTVYSEMKVAIDLQDKQDQNGFVTFFYENDRFIMVSGNDRFTLERILEQEFNEVTVGNIEG